MKRAAAIVLSLMFIWLQAVAFVQTPFANASPARSCCSCNKACCVSQSAPNPQSLPLAPSPASAQQDFSALVSMLVVWSLPATGSSVFSSPTTAPLPAPAVPLFARHCALLI
jgi:hypothetical protein